MRLAIQPIVLDRDHGKMLGLKDCGGLSGVGLPGDRSSSEPGKADIAPAAEPTSAGAARNPVETVYGKTERRSI